MKDFFYSVETFQHKIELFVSMSTTSKIAIGVGLASGALLAAWLLTGSRKAKTKEYVVKKAQGLKETLKTSKKPFDDSEVHYV